MSGLAAVLAGRRRPGVYRWPATFEPDEVAHTVAGAGRRFGYVDGWRRQTRAEVLAALGEALGFPDHYGRNLDALADSLRDLEGEWVLLWDGWATLARVDQRAFAVVVELLGDHADRVTTLLRGDGPEVGVTTLD